MWGASFWKRGLQALRRYIDGLLCEPRPKVQAWCDCGNELTRDPHATVIDDANGVQYRCGHCRNWSLWDFDAPVPLRIRPKI